jgi:hypothetical protein
VAVDEEEHPVVVVRGQAEPADAQVRVGPVAGHIGAADAAEGFRQGPVAVHLDVLGGEDGHHRRGLAELLEVSGGGVDLFDLELQQFLEAELLDGPGVGFLPWRRLGDRGNRRGRGQKSDGDNPVQGPHG